MNMRAMVVVDLGYDVVGVEQVAIVLTNDVQCDDIIY
jgi:hypothetical protein